MKFNKIFSKESLRKLILLVTTGISLVGLITPALAYVKDKVYKFIIININDTHGHFYPDAHGEGGFAAVKTIIDRIRKENPNIPVLVLSAGDFNTGTPESDLLYAKPDIDAMNDIGFDAVAVGNHEFDPGYQEMLIQKHELKAPLISANIVYRNPKTGAESYFYKRYVWLVRDGLKFLIIGNTTPSTRYTDNPKSSYNFEFQDPARAFLAAKNGAELFYGKPDVVISLSHLGLFFNGNHGDRPYGDYVMDEILGKQQGADLYVTGHTHVLSCVYPNGSPVLNYKPGEPCHPPKTPNGKYLFQAGAFNKYVGEIVYTFKNGKTTFDSYTLIPVNLSTKEIIDGKTKYVTIGKPVPQDPELYTKLTKYYQEGQAQLQQVVGNLSEPLVQTRFRQTKLGTFIANCYLWKVHADVAILNSGAMRQGLPGGNITYKDVLSLAPYGNTVTTVELTGNELVNYIKTVAFYQGGPRPQYAGITFKVAQDHKLYDFMIQGEPLNPNKTYKLAVLSFQAVGGDKYPVITNNPSYVDTGFVSAKVIVQYLQAHPNIDVSKLPIDGPGANYDIIPQSIIDKYL